MENNTRETALYFLRKLAYLLYLEIAALQPHIHRELAEKAKLKTAYFQREKERQSVDLYRESESANTPADILAPYVDRTGLTLEDVYRALKEGDWRNKHGGYNFGGPKWIKIADLTVQLYQQMEQENWEEVENLLFQIKSQKTNQGYLITLFDRSERKRNERRR